MVIYSTQRPTDLPFQPDTCPGPEPPDSICDDCDDKLRLVQGDGGALRAGAGSRDSSRARCARGGAWDHLYGPWLRRRSALHRRRRARCNRHRGRPRYQPPRPGPGCRRHRSRRNDESSGANATPIATGKKRRKSAGVVALAKRPDLRAWTVRRPFVSDTARNVG